MKLFCVILFCAACGIAGARPFKNTKGQSLEGTLSRVDSKTAYITGAGGKKLTVPLAMLCEEDRKFCEEWRAANPEIKLKVKAEGFTEKGTRNTENSSTSDGPNTGISARTRVVKEGYRITVSNWSSDPGAKLSGLKVEYAIVVGWMNTAAAGDKRGVKNVHKGSFDLPELAGTKEQSVPTETVVTGQSAALATTTRTDSDGDTSTSQAGALYRESMDGICLVVKHGDRIVATYTTGKVPKEVQLEMSK